MHSNNQFIIRLMAQLDCKSLHVNSLIDLIEFDLNESERYDGIERGGIDLK